MLILLLLIPRLEALIVADPAPMPIRVCVLPLPAILQFITVLFCAELEPSATVCIQITAEDVPMLLLIMVRSRLADTAGQTELTVLPKEPSIVTLSAPFSVIKPAAAVPETDLATPVGLIKIV